MYAHVQAVVFDAVGTLIKPRHAVADTYQAIGREHGFVLSTAEIDARFHDAFAAQEARDADEGTWRTSEQRAWSRSRAIVGDVFATAKPAGDFERLFETLWEHFAAPENWTLYDDAAATWQAVVASGRVVGIASNLDERLRLIGAGLPPLDSCQHWFISSQLGVRKPCGAFFTAIERRMNVPPARLLLVGDDHHNDYQGAVARGWNAVLLDRDTVDPNAVDHDGASASAPSLSNLGQLLAMLPGHPDAK